MTSTKHSRRELLTRWVVIHDHYNDAGDNVTTNFGILYGTEAEATECMNHLNAGSDRSFFDPDGEGFLYVDQQTFWAEAA